MYRLPIMHSSGFVYMIYALSVMNLPKWKCPVDGDLYAMGTEKRTEEWQYRIRHIQGAIISMGIVQMILGYSGKFIHITNQFNISRFYKNVIPKTGKYSK